MFNSILKNFSGHVEFIVDYVNDVRIGNYDSTYIT